MRPAEKAIWGSVAERQAAVEKFAEKIRKQSAEAHKSAQGVFEIRLWHKPPHPPGVMNYEVVGVGPDEASAWAVALTALAGWYGCSEEEMLVLGGIG